MTARNHRRHHRLPYSGYVNLSWTDTRGQVKYARTKCLDISDSGLSLEAPEPIALRSSVSIRAERLNLSGSATVRYVIRLGAKFILGLELSAAVPSKTLAAVKEPHATPDR
jgi:PilZ domain